MKRISHVEYYIRVIVLALSLTPAFTGSVRSADSDLILPIDYYPFLSSSFGEPRPGRFHYGIDYKSGGTIGKDLYAVGDGSIVRVGSSPGGYGKVLYIQLDSGRMAVYGHMSAFMPEIERKMAQLRRERGTYDVTWWPVEGEHRVQAGQVIGTSGDSGSWGAPHLHFELRDMSSNALNPFNEGYEVTDTIPPHMTSVVLIPLDHTSTVNGLPTPVWLPLDGGDEPVRIDGRVGVAAGLWDRMNNSNNTMGVYEASLVLDGTPIFTKRYDRLSYTMNGRGSLDYLIGEFHDGSGTISALFRHPGNLLDFYEGSGIIDTSAEPSGAHTITIAARDYAGNPITHHISAVFGPLPSFEYCGIDDGLLRIVGDYPGGFLERIECSYRDASGDWVGLRDIPVDARHCDVTVPAPNDRTSLRIVLVGRDSVRSAPVLLTCDPDAGNASSAEPLSVAARLLHDRVIVTVVGEEQLSAIPVMSVSDNGLDAGAVCPVPDGESTWTGSIPLTEPGRHDLAITVNARDRGGNPVDGAIQLDVTVLDMFENGSIASDDHALTVYVPPGAIYRNVPAIITDEQAGQTRELTPLSSGYRLHIGEERLREAVTAHVTVEGDIPHHAALFYRNGENGNGSNGGWRFLSGERKGQVFSGGMSHPGAVAVFEDRVSPRVVPALPRAGAAIRNARPLIRAGVSDEGAGLAGSDSIRMLLDGEPVYGEYDTGRDRVSYQPLDDLPPGEHTVRITVTDQTGNETTREWSFSTTQ